MFKGFGTPPVTQEMKLTCAFNALIDLINKKAINAGEKPNRLHIAHCANSIVDDGKPQGWEVVNVPIRWDVLFPGKPNLVPVEASTLAVHEKVPVLDMSGYMVTGVYDLNTKVLHACMQMDGPDRDAQVYSYNVGTNRPAPGTGGADITTALEKVTAFCMYKSLLTVVDTEDKNVMDELHTVVASELGVEPKLVPTI